MASSAATPESLSYAAARAQVLGTLVPLAPEPVPVAEARGRALRRAITAAHPLPPFRNSSMDGFAVRSDDLAKASPGDPVTLPVAAVLRAGRVAPHPLAPGEVMRIMTGAMLPDGADAVVPLEEAAWLQESGSDGAARFASPVTPGANIRDVAHDLAAGETALPEGRELSAHDLALLVALGETQIAVGPAPRVALLSTGDELLEAGAPLEPGRVRDSNLPMLSALVGECGGRVTMAERLPDDAARVAERIVAVLEGADAVLTIGGISVGDFDPVRQALSSLGGVELWRVAMRPGRPQAFGMPRGRLFFGLPGNPGSVACVFETLVRPALRRLQGFADLDRPRLPVRLAADLDSSFGRTDFVWVTLGWRDGGWWATPAGERVSGHIAPQSRAHALLVIPDQANRLAAGDPATAFLLRWPSGVPA